MEKLDSLTPDLTQENIDRIAALFPECATEAENESGGGSRRAIDFDVLRDLLSDDIVDGRRERYQFTWPGKAKARLEARTPTNKTMRPVPERSVDWDGTQNLYVEGDNLEALKIMRETYAGKVKLIYIDPPYNTGSDRFIYPDDYVQDIDTYTALDGDYDTLGNRLVENKASFGRFHSAWCSMMYQRLLLLRDLLSQDGFIAVSINDTEVFSLGKLMDEVFGIENKMACSPWRSEPSGGKDKTALRTGHEYILFYRRSADADLVYQEIADGETNLEDEWGPYRKGRELRKWGATSARSDRPNLWFGITAPNGEVVYPYKNDGTEGYWRWGRDKQEMKDLLADPSCAHWEYTRYDEGIVVDGDEARWVPYEKVRSTTHLFGWNTWLDGYGTNADATAELKELFDGKKPFDTPKPTKLLKWIVGLCKDSEDTIILDVFSGAAGTADAVMRLNAEDLGRRQFIMVQLPEPCADGSIANELGLKTICDLGEERIRRAGEKVRAEMESANAQLMLGEEPKTMPDLGFRVLRVGDSVLKDVHADPVSTGQTSLLDLIDNMEEGATPLDLLFQVLPKFRIPYSCSIEEREVDGRTVLDVEGGQLLACFDEDVSTATIEAIAKARPLYAVFRDASFADDSAVANLEELFKTFSPDTIRRVI